MHAHATMSAWQRAEDGSYEAELHGWKLHVRWQPESAHHRRGFRWHAVRPAGAAFEALAVREEIEIAMAEAEHFAAHGEGETRPE